MRLSYVNIIFVRAGMSELADEADSKSVCGNAVWVQVPPPALLIRGQDGKAGKHYGFLLFAI